MSKDLIAKLQQKQEQDRRKVEELTSRNLTQLSENLTSVAEKELTSTKKSIESQVLKIKNSLETVEDLTGRLSQLTMKPFVSMLLTIVLILLIICGGGWVGMQYLSKRIVDKSQQLFQINKSLERLNKLEMKVQFREDSTYIVLPMKPDMWESTKGSWVVEIKNKKD